MDSKSNHIYIGNTDKLLPWSGHTPTKEDDTIIADDGTKKVVVKVKELIKNYLQEKIVAFSNAKLVIFSQNHLFFHTNINKKHTFHITLTQYLPFCTDKTTIK